ncbi:universal stress protein [Algibacter pacificus]|uniref:universal stress protein n=1 Tax=Algibacter pacificus TaxID=2599389 RepID=UPI0011C7661D|nr:universal stress protein [Algibacter pacificus]
MKNILLLSDFSSNSKNAMHYAMHFFKNEICTFYLMHVHKIRSFVSDDLMHSPKESIYQSITKVPREKLNSISEELKTTYKNDKHQFEIHIDFDVFTDAVKQAVKTKHIDFIVMGTNGISGAKEVLFGSNTINVIKKVHCKTLAIPEDYKFSPMKELFLPLDSRDHIEGKHYLDLLEFIEAYQLNLHVLRINPNHENQKIEKEDKSNLSILACKYHVVNGVPMEFALLTYLQTNPIDVLVVFMKKERVLDTLFSQKSTQISISKIPKPVLVLHA